MLATVVLCTFLLRGRWLPHRYWSTPGHRNDRNDANHNCRDLHHPSILSLVPVTLAGCLVFHTGPQLALSVGCGAADLITSSTAHGSVAPTCGEDAKSDEQNDVQCVPHTNPFRKATASDPTGPTIVAWTQQNTHQKLWPSCHLLFMQALQSLEPSPIVAPHSEQLALIPFRHTA
jgi:hypothetical protein